MGIVGNIGKRSLGKLQRKEDMNVHYCDWSFFATSTRKAKTYGGKTLNEKQQENLRLFLCKIDFIDNSDKKHIVAYTSIMIKKEDNGKEIAKKIIDDVIARLGRFERHMDVEPWLEFDSSKNEKIIDEIRDRLEDITIDNLNNLK